MKTAFGKTRTDSIGIKLNGSTDTSTIDVSEVESFCGGVVLKPYMEHFRHMIFRGTSKDFNLFHITGMSYSEDQRLV